tara:strand:- start:350 stop:1396 length:1047 start_codon:yes stop_codon:yes gene_type:complete
MSTSSTEIINEEPNVTGSSQSVEDKFFGVQTEINTNPSNEVEIEVIDDTPKADRRPKKFREADSKVDSNDVDKEIADYSQRAADRINQIKYEYHEERRAKESSARMAKEATVRLQTILQENQRLQEMVNKGGEALNKTVHNNALWAKQSATDAYKKAYEEGNADAMAKSQELLTKATYAEQQAGSTAQQVQNQILQKMPIIKPEAAQQLAPQKLDPDLEKWGQKNPWFMSNSEPIHKAMTSYSLYLDEKLQTDGINPASESEKYYSEVDRAMRKEFPSFFGVQADSNSEMVSIEETPKRQPRTVVASVSRDSGNKKPTQIRLTKTQVNLARQLGITPEQYANQLLKEN